LIQESDGYFYGTTTSGGSSGDGTVFKVQPFSLTVTAGNLVNYQIMALNGPTIYGASGLPGGVGVNTASGLISGTPTVGGTYNTTMIATNGSGTGSATLVITVQAPPTIANGPPPATGTVSTPYAFAYTFTGYPSPVFSVSAGALPAGLSLSSTGTITGSPTQAGTFTGTVMASNGIGSSATQGFSITILSTYSSWAALYFTAQQLSDPTVSGPNATPQNDGVINLLKYVYDINPTETMTAADMAALPVGSFTTISGQKYLCLTYRQNAFLSGYTVSLQSSPDLHNWTTVAPDLSQQLGTDPVTGDPIVRVGVNVTNSSQEFLRLSVTSP
jgi:uncharacterized repeat protein (TIGR03803 family)